MINIDQPLGCQVVSQFQRQLAALANSMPCLCDFQSRPMWLLQMILPEYICWWPCDCTCPIIPRYGHDFLTM